MSVISDSQTTGPFYSLNTKILNGHHNEKSLLLYVIKKCNQRCSHCFWLNMDDNYFSDEIMDVKKAKGVLEYFYNKGIRCAGIVAEGEITLYPYLDELIPYAKGTGFEFISTFTNGINLDRYGDLFCNNLNLLNISLDGYDGESYAKNRRSSQTIFNKIIRNIEATVEKKNSANNNMDISIGSTIGNSNLHFIEKMIRLSETLRVNRIEFYNYHMINNSDEYWSSLRYNDPRVLQYFDQVKSRSDYTVDIVLPNLAGGKSFYWCGNSNDVITIGTSGDFAPCCALPPHITYGNYCIDPQSYLTGNMQLFRKQITNSKKETDLPAHCRLCPKLSMEVDIFFAKQKKWMKRISAPGDDYIWNDYK